MFGFSPCQYLTGWLTKIQAFSISHSSCISICWCNPKILYSSSFTTWCNLIRSINVVSQLILRRFCMPYQICHAGWCNWRVWWVLEWFIHVSNAMGCITIIGEHTKVVTILKACRLWTDLLVTISTDQAWVRSGWVKRKIFVSNCDYFEDNHGWIIFKTNIKVTEAFLLHVIGIWPCCISHNQFRPCQWWRFIWLFDKID